jgi:hypothetical protein
MGAVWSLVNTSAIEIGVWVLGSCPIRTVIRP